LVNDDLARLGRRFASPQITSTLFFFIRKPTPPFMRSERCRASGRRPPSTSALTVPFDLQAVVLGCLA
jgi:hypothetical protein